ncbi:MAG: sensor histidine kinase [Anaerolineales bacterium]
MTTWAILGHFFHGLTFFTLGLMIYFLQYRNRRITLARRLSWLEVCLFCEAIIAWNDLLARLSPDLHFLPAVIRLPILAIGYSFLAAFGLQAFLIKNNPSDDTTGRARWLLAAVHLLWLIPYLAALKIASPQIPQLTQDAEVLIRYGVAFPGGLLAAAGLRRESYQVLDPKLRGRIRHYMRLVEVMTGMFGVLNLALAPPASFMDNWHLPQTESLTAWLWGFVGFGLAWGLVRALTTIQLEIEHWIESIERMQALTADRERISRELHDGIIQSIYAVGLLLESVQNSIPTQPERAQAQLGRVMDSLNEVIQDLRRYIFDLRGDMPDDTIKSGIQRLLRDFHINTLLETDFNVTGAPPDRTFSIERRRHIFQIVREALANTARHAEARWAKLHLHYGEEALDLTISDDGVGMETLLVSKGYGLRNIRERARLLDGTLRVESAPGAGVTYHLTVPY